MPKQGEFIWHDLATSDMDAATAFYTDTIGWKAVPMDQSPMPYTFFQVGDAGVGGVMTLSDDMKKMGAVPSWTPCMATEDIDAFCKKVTSLGGQVLNGPLNARRGSLRGVSRSPRRGLRGLPSR